MKILKYLLLLYSVSVVANDLDDGISLDTPINDDLELDVNTNFLMQRALAQAKEKKKNPGKNKHIITAGCEGVGNIALTGVKLKPNTTIINFSNNKKASSICEK